MNPNDALKNDRNLPVSSTANTQTPNYAQSYNSMSYAYPYMYNQYGYYYGYNVAPPFYAVQPPQYIHQPPIITSSINPQNMSAQPIYGYSNGGNAAGYRPDWWKSTKPPPPQTPPPQPKAPGSSLSVNTITMKFTNRVAAVRPEKTPDIFKKDTSDQSQPNSSEPAKIDDKKLKREIPQSLKDYVRNSFNGCTTNLQKDEMEIQVRDLMKKSLDDGSAFTIDWTKLQLLKPLSIVTPDKKNTKKNKRKNDKVKTKPNNQQPVVPVVPVDIIKRNERRQRFLENAETPVVVPTVKFDISQNKSGGENVGTIVGTSKALEKTYLRLTTAPDPATVRPLVVLEKSFDHVMKKWKENKNYSYVSEQLKCIRQDLTIQSVKNEFTVEVYEVNGRIALQMSDREEFNQCQTCLKQLYREGIVGHENEFLVYNILYLTYTSNHAELANLLTTLTPSNYQQPNVKLAIDLYVAYNENNYLRFFKIYNKIDMVHAKYLIDLFVDKVRANTLRAIVSTYLPTVTYHFLTQNLNFDSIKDLKAWLEKQSIPLNNAEDVDCKAIRTQVANLSL